MLKVRIELPISYMIIFWMVGEGTGQNKCRQTPTVSQKQEGRANWGCCWQLRGLTFYIFSHFYTTSIFSFWKVDNLLFIEHFVTLFVLNQRFLLGILMSEVCYKWPITYLYFPIDLHKCTDSTFLCMALKTIRTVIRLRSCSAKALRSLQKLSNSISFLLAMIDIWWFCV